MTGATGRPATECTIRRATTGDAELLATLGERTFRETFAAENSAADMDAYVAHAYGVAQQRAELSLAEAVFLVAEVEGNAVGYAYVRGAPLPAHITDPAPGQPGPSVEIARFYVDAPWHGRGIAHRLMDAAIAEAAQRGALTIWLGVWERNARGIRFYTKRGFQDIGSQPFALGSDLQRDRVMARAVAP